MSVVFVPVPEDEEVEMRGQTSTAHWNNNVDVRHGSFHFTLKTNFLLMAVGAFWGFLQGMADQFFIAVKFSFCLQQ